MRRRPVVLRREEDHTSSDHFNRAVKYHAASILTFIGASTALLHELTNKRRIAVYYGSDAAMLTSLVLGVIAAKHLYQGFQTLNPAPIELVESGAAAGLLPGGLEVKKPFGGIASRNYLGLAIGLGVIGLGLSMGGTAEENYRIHNGFDKNITGLTELVLGFGMALTIGAAVAAVVGVKQRIWEKQHPGHGTATPYEVNPPSCLSRCLYRM